MDFDEASALAELEADEKNWLAKHGIVYSTNGTAWVFKDKRHYAVYRATVTHGVTDSAYPLTQDGLSIAIARTDYLAKHGKLLFYPRLQEEE